MPGTRGKTVCSVLLSQSEHEAHGGGWDAGGAWGPTTRGSLRADARGFPTIQFLPGDCAAPAPRPSEPLLGCRSAGFRKFSGPFPAVLGGGPGSQTRARFKIKLLPVVKRQFHLFKKNLKISSKNK